MDSDNVAHLIQKRDSRSDSYAQSWYAVHYFNADGERQKRLQRYLSRWAGGTKGEAAVEGTLAESYAQLDTVLHNYAQSPSFECLRIEPTEPLAAPRVTTRPMSTAEAHHHVGDLLLALFGPTDEALQNLEEAARLAPGDAKNLIALARAHARKAEAGGEESDASLAKAAEYAESAERLAPDDPERFAVVGDVHRLRAHGLRVVGDAAALDELKKARSAYRKAVHRDDTQADALFGLGLTYMIEDDGAEEAQVALEGAAYLLPLDTQVAATLGALQLLRGNHLQAIAPLQYVLDWSKNDKQRAAAKAALDEIRTGVAREGASGG
jgi:tetratricopeptide (TPR) repeat protein